MSDKEARCHWCPSRARGWADWTGDGAPHPSCGADLHGLNFEPSDTSLAELRSALAARDAEVVELRRQLAESMTLEEHASLCGEIEQLQEHLAAAQAKLAVIAEARTDFERDYLTTEKWAYPESRERSLVTRHLNRVDRILSSPPVVSGGDGEQQRWTCPDCGDTMPPGFDEEDHLNCNWPSDFPVGGDNEEREALAKVIYEHTRPEGISEPWERISGFRTIRRYWEAADAVLAARPSSVVNETKAEALEELAAMWESTTKTHAYAMDDADWDEIERSCAAVRAYAAYVRAGYLAIRRSTEEGNTE